MNDNTEDCTNVVWTEWGSFCDESGGGGDSTAGPSSGGGGTAGTVIVEPDPEGEQEEIDPLGPMSIAQQAQDWHDRMPELSHFKSTEELVEGCKKLWSELNDDADVLRKYEDRLVDEEESDRVSMIRVRMLRGNRRVARNVLRFDRGQYRTWDCDSVFASGD